LDDTPKCTVTQNGLKDESRRSVGLVAHFAIPRRELEKVPLVIPAGVSARGIKWRRHERGIIHACGVKYITPF
jgi:hypothetical protein